MIARSTRFDRFSASSSIRSVLSSRFPPSSSLPQTLSLCLSLSPDSPRCNVRGRSSHEWNSSSSGKKGPLLSLSLSLCPSPLPRSTTAVLRSKTWQIVYTRANDHRRRFALRFASSFPFLLLSNSISLDLPSKFRPFIRGGSLRSESDR